MIRTAFLTLVILLCAPAAYADEFGSRFGNTSPYALQNTMNKASQDTQGLSMEDLNEITPAAGEEKPDAEQANEAAAQDNPVSAPDTPATERAEPKAVENKDNTEQIQSDQAQ